MLKQVFVSDDLTPVMLYFLKLHVFPSSSFAGHKPATPKPTAHTGSWSKETLVIEINIYNLYLKLFAG